MCILSTGNIIFGVILCTVVKSDVCASPHLLFVANWNPQLNMVYCCVKCNYNIMQHVFCRPHNFLNVLCNCLWNTASRLCWLQKCASLSLWLIILFQIICHVFLNISSCWNMFQIAVVDVNGMCGMYSMYFFTLNQWPLSQNRYRICREVTSKAVGHFWKNWSLMWLYVNYGYYMGTAETRMKFAWHL